ncbi:hypothetical protein MKW92_021725 [Papaver armeniacum]|nr:hypothetical protein MKW92_021725 [Papaver armeniacum]
MLIKRIPDFYLLGSVWGFYSRVPVLLQMGCLLLPLNVLHHLLRMNKSRVGSFAASVIEVAIAENLADKKVMHMSKDEKPLDYVVRNMWIPV